MIEFPHLGINLKIAQVAVNIFGIDIYWYSIMITLGFTLALFFSLKNAKSFGLEKEVIIDGVLVVFPIAVICARLYYVVFNLNYYITKPLEILNIRSGGLGIYGAVIGAFVTTYFYSRYKKLETLKLFDIAASYFPLAQAIGRWGNFFNQEAFGINTTLPWGMTGDKIKQEIISMNNVQLNPDIPVHPTFLYESIWDLTVFFILLWYKKKTKKNGEIFLLYMALYGVGRFFVEGLRTDSLMLGMFRISQVLALIFALVCTILFIIYRKKTNACAKLD